MKNFKFELLKEFSFSHLFLLRKKMNYVLNTSELIMALNPDSLEVQQNIKKYERNSKNIDRAMELSIRRVKEKTLTRTIGVVTQTLN